MKEDWTDILRRKLEGHEVPPPEGLWEDICKEMGLDPEPVRKPTASRRWWWAAAAAVLAIVGFFAVHKSSDSEPSQQANVDSHQPAIYQPAIHQPAEENPVVEEPQTKEPLLALAPQYNNKVEKASTVSDRPAEAEETQPESPSETLQKPEEPQRSENSEVRRTEKPEVSTERYDYQTSAEEKREQAQRDRWSVGLNASGGLLAASNNVRTDRLYYDFTNGYASSASAQHKDAVGFTNEAYTRTEFVSKHHLPVRFGLSVQYQLNPRLALHSGISYTRLYSEFSIPLHPAVHYDQRLHYLGIPLGATWQLWSANRFRIYLSGGVVLEKCVSADLEQDAKLSRKPWQWSLDAAAGAEYSFTRQFGFYLEPSLGYYFDDGTSLEHYYKEHPLAPSIEFGLRLHL